MAVVQGHLSVQLQDGNPTTKAVTQFFKTTSGLIADMQSWAAGYLPVLDAVTQSKIVKAQLIIPLTLPGGLKSAPVAGSNNMVGALFDWLNASNIDKFGAWYPNWITAGFVTANPELVNQADGGPVAAFIAYLLGTTATTVSTDEDIFPYSAIARAIKSSRSFRKQLA